MKRVISIIVFAVMVSHALVGQRVSVTEILKVLPNSQADIMYENEFGRFKNEQALDSFPFAVICVELQGNAQEVTAAKTYLNLDLGSQRNVQDKITTKENQILFLVPQKAQNITLTCGDGCEQIKLYSGKLIVNKVYVCKVHFTPAVKRTGETKNVKWVIQPESIKNLVNVKVTDGETTIEGSIIDDDLAYHDFEVGVPYSYEISYNLYADVAGTFTIDASEKVHYVNVRMEESYNYIKVTSDNNKPVSFTVGNYGTTYSSTNKNAGPFPAGKYVVHCMQEDYVSQDYTVTLNGDKKTVEVNTHLTHEKGGIKVTSTPKGARVFIDNVEKGVTPYTSSEVATGKHTVSVKKTDYVPMDTSITVYNNSQTPVHFTMNGQANVQLTTESYVTLYISPRGANQFRYLKQGSWTGELEVGSYDIKATAADCDEGITQIEVRDKIGIFSIPCPPHQKGYLSVDVTPASATVYVDGHPYYNKKNIELETGQHSVYVSKTGYLSSGTRTVQIYNRSTREEKFTMESEWLHGDDYHASNFFEFNYGIGLYENKGLNNVEHYVGMTYAYIPQRFGFDVSVNYGINPDGKGTLMLTAGPMMRLTDFDSPLNLQLYLGGGGAYDMDNNQFKWVAEGGLRFGFEPEDFNLAYYSFTLGAKYMNDAYMSQGEWIPTVGLSILPIMCKLGTLEEAFPQNRLEAMAGYSFTTNNWKYGFNYSYTKAHIGGYVQGLFGANNNYSVTAGPTFRLTNDGGAVDLQLYQGIGWIRDGGMDRLGGESGLRLAFDNIDTEGFGWWSLNCAYEYATGGYHGINFGVSLMPVAACVLLAGVESSLPAHRLDFVAGVGFDSNKWKLGLNYSYTPSCIGFYLQGLIGWQDNASATAGITFRTTPYSDVIDLQLYQGMGWFWDNNHMIGGETGLRLAFGNGSRGGNFGLWSLNCAFEYAQYGYMGINFGTTIIIPGLILTLGLTAFAL